MQQRIIYFGPPGTGKTSRLLEHVRDAIHEDGVDPTRVAFVAFSRKAAAEARERASAELGLTGDELTHWRTLHSTAARQLGVRGQDLVVGEHWKTLGGLLDLDFADLDEAGRSVSFKRDRGARAQSIYSVRRARGQSLALGDLAREYPVEDARLVDLFNWTLGEYKRLHGLRDYADLLADAPGRLPVDVAFIDEAQDLTPSQWDYALRLVADASVVYVAGDDDQALFDWAGADVRRFLALEGERRVLDESHRLPLAVYQRAVGILSRLKIRQPKDWRPSPREGLVETVGDPDRVDVTTGDWLLLARTRGLLDQWEYVCRAAGVRYVKAGRDSVKPDEARAIRAWETARRGRRVAGDDLIGALHLAGDDRELDPRASYALADLGWPDAPGWRDALTAIPPARRRYYEACLRRDPRSLTDSAQVTLSTIHGAKGGEASHVALLTDTTPRVDEGRRRDPDSEHRVWYVAATRARETLTLVKPLGDRSYTV